ncbi:MAG: 23S rRNA (guanosine(2251)-2'-O)-methyltransferase RlmB [Anaerolineales bacterium]|nr:23S rRNA (guanosine(2251)-2'-O)-methyltransferase RlmB [Anaerolineales bacterium]
MNELLFRRNAVRECLRAGRRRIDRLTVARDSDLAPAHDILAEARRRQIPIVESDRKRLNLAAHGEPHQGVLLEVGPYPYVDLEDILEWAGTRREPALIVLLDLVQDPRNVGALLRTAEAMGVHGIVIQERRGCDITPTVVTTSAGAAEHLRVAQVTNLVDAMRRLRQRDVWLFGLGLSPEAEPLSAVDLNLPLGLVIGNEGDGLRRLVRDRCDRLIRLPMHGQVQSLNAAVAGSIALYAARAARSEAGQA